MTGPAPLGGPGCPLGPLSTERPTPPAGAVAPAPPQSTEAATRGTSDKLLFLSSGAIVGLSGDPGVESLAVAPTDSSDHNTVRQGLRPIACWGTVDSRFAFDSSFIQPEMRADLAQLRVVVEKNPAALLSVFGHADPVGAAGYNKLLSGRRASAVYAVLTRKVGIWTQLASTPMGRDQWDPTAFSTMKSALEAAGKPAPAAHPALIKAYMDFLCTDPDGKTFEVPPGQFLGKGRDPKGKADFQGCGEFNPLRIFSLDEEQSFAAADRHPERDARNAPNRRVLVFLFPADTDVEVAKWPCPRATEGISGCQLRLWSDAAKRAGPGEEEKQHPEDETFSCRFYDRLARRSPCEQIRESVVIRLYDAKGRALPGAKFRLSLDGVILQQATADARGVFSVVVPSRKIRALLEWSPKGAKDPPGSFTFGDEVCPGADPDNPADTEDCLINLGYSGGSTLAVKVKGFQEDYGPAFSLKPTGVLDPGTQAAIREVYTSDADNIRQPRATGRGANRDA
ncbi:MAG: OmpA family protein [Gemmatimonadota bacterium]